ncbi:hypothetical protein [Neisseria chenwenguii]|nr:hypothetical protein [Neisseria chenwenguii]
MILWHNGFAPFSDGLNTSCRLKSQTAASVPQKTLETVGRILESDMT